MSEFGGNNRRRDPGMPLGEPPYDSASDQLRAERLGGSRDAERRDGRFAWRGLLRDKFVKQNQIHPDLPVGDQ